MHADSRTVQFWKVIEATLPDFGKCSWMSGLSQSAEVLMKPLCVVGMMQTCHVSAEIGDYDVQMM